MMATRIVVFGASGGTGQHVVAQALERGHDVCAFVRDPRKVRARGPQLQMHHGDVRCATDVEDALRPQDVVVCCLGTPASDRSQLRAAGTANIVHAMARCGATRLICQTSLGFGDSVEVLPWHMKYLIVPLLLKAAFEDHARQEQIIERSPLDWTIVRPGNLTNGRLTKTYRTAFAPTERITLKISRADVAHFMLDHVAGLTNLRTKVGISYSRHGGHAQHQSRL